MERYARRVAKLLVWLTLIQAPTSLVAEAAKRVALVIGNSNYEQTSTLPNPANDARLMSQVLTAHGFEVLEHTNIDLKKMKRAVAELSSKARSYGKDTVVLFYFAGHGVQVGQVNHLIPIDARIESEGDVAIEGLNVASILESLSDAGAAINLVILDACRNNPYRTSFRSPARGLARVDGPPGFLIAFSTDPGKVATDGPTGGNSPYTRALATSLQRPGVKIEEALKAVRKEVYELTNGNQVPWETSSLLQDLYIAGGSKGTTTVSQDLQATAKVDAELQAAKKLAQRETDRAKEELAKAEAARLKAKTDTERARSEAERATAELAKAQAEAELARVQVDTARKIADANALRAQTAASQRTNAAPIVTDTTALFNPSAVPSFSCSEYAVKPVGHVDRNPQTDVFCIVAEAANADYRLGQAFRRHLANYGANEKRAIITLQKRWILARNSRCSASWSDIENAITRNAVAQCLVRETNSRIQELQR